MEILKDNPSFKRGEHRTVTVDFGQNVKDFTCTVFLWGKNTLMPLCESFAACEAPVPEDGIRIKAVNTAEIGKGKLAVTVESYNLSATDNIVLIGSIENSSGECVDTHMLDISGLISGKRQTVVLDFERNIEDFTCKLFLWDKSLLMPLCPKWTNV